MQIAAPLLINRLATIYVVLFCFVPPMQVGTAYRMIAIVSAVVWLLTALVVDPRFVNGKVKNLIILSVMCIGFMFLWRLNVEGPADAFANVLQTIIIILIGLMSFFMFKNDRKFSEVILTIVLIVICYYCITTIQATIDNPYASRIANSEWLEERFEGNANVGLYGYVYMCVFILPVLLYKILNKVHINKAFDILSYAAVVLIYVMVLLAGYMIAIVCTILSTIMIVAFRKTSVINIIFTIVIGFLILIFYDKIIEKLIEFISIIIGDNPVYNTKLDGFLQLYQEGEMGDSAWGSRFKNYSASWMNIVKYPIAGCYFFGSTGGGGHSAILDTIGRYGWLTAVIYFEIIWKYPKKVYSYKSRKHLLYKVMLVIALLFGMLDPYTQEMAIPWFLMTPFMVYKDEEQENIKARKFGEMTNG